MKSLIHTRYHLSEKICAVLNRPARRRTILLVGLSATLLSTPSVDAVELPRACVAGACGINNVTNQPITWVTSGAATASQSSDTLTINQSTENVTLNWASFNISADGHVIFSQPSVNSIALNRIFQESPSQILGSIKTQLNSDPDKVGGQIYLVNPNGFLFGSGSSVNASGILVSTLGISEDNFEKGLLTAKSRGKPSLGDDPGSRASSFIQASHLFVQDANGNDLWFDSSGKRVDQNDPQAQKLAVEIVVKQGAAMSTETGGRILLASQKVENSGKLSTPEGQVILAAGDRVYLSPSPSNSLRGLLVEVAVGGSAYNTLTGDISATHGDVTLIGASVNQDGRISASTSVSENGSVHLLARYADKAPQFNGDVLVAHQTGTVTLGANSSIDVSADVNDNDTAFKEQVQLKPEVSVVGKDIVMLDGAKITAHGGNLTMQASSDAQDLLAVDPSAHIRINPGAVIDVSGSNAERSVADNIVTVELRGAELADSPDQRNGALSKQTVTVDARIGTPIANVQGAIGSIGETVAQRTSAGGKAVFISTGDVVTGQGATIDVSGGKVNYTGAMVSTTQLITADGKSVDIGSAKEDVTYIGVANPITKVRHDRWGVTESIGQQTGMHYEAGYTLGSDAGSVQFSAPSMILNGTLTGQVFNGAYQRDPASQTGIAKGGQLIIGTASTLNADYRAPAVLIAPDAANIDIDNDSDVPLGIPVTLSTNLFTQGGFTRAEIYSNGNIDFASGAPLTLLDGSSLKVFTTTQVNVGSSVTAKSGAINIAGGKVNVADHVVFDVSGQWINDTELLNNAIPTVPLYQNAGSVSLATTTPLGSLTIGNNVRFNANGGAWLKASNTIIGGAGGSISLQSATGNSSFTLGDQVQLNAYGVNNAAGGTFTLSAGKIQITPRNTWADYQVYDPMSADSLGYFTITPKLFTDHGFSTFNINATGGTLASQGDAFQIVSNTQVNSVISTILLPSTVRDLKSGADISGIGEVTTLPAFMRSGSILNFSVTPYAGFGETQSVGALDVQRTARVTGDPGTRINLTAVGGNIVVGGELTAPAGSINLLLKKPTVSANTLNDPALGIEIGSTAKLDVSGTTVLTPNDANLLSGSIKDGGAISLQADRGSLLIDNGARLDVSGTSSLIDLVDAKSPSGYSRTQVGSNAGSIALTAAESIVINTQAQDISAHAGSSDLGTGKGGSLTLHLTRDNADITDINRGSFGPDPRIVEVTNNLTASGSMPQPGLASIAVDQLAGTGIDDLQLTADDKIVLDAGIALTMQRRVQLDAPVLEVTTPASGDAAVSVNASYVSLGSSRIGVTAPQSSPGNGQINVNASQMIELMGHSSTSNIGEVNLTSSQDIRLRGTVSSNDLSGSFQTSGNLTMQSSRVYATTATQFGISAMDSIDPVTGDAQQHTIEIKQNGVAPDVLLSAASSITLNATNIIQGGTLLAPFGTINLNASENLTLKSGSVTSVSANGNTIPYGFTDANGKNWYYRTANTHVTDVPSRAVTLNGNNVAIDDKATVDLSGGGDLYAPEWTKGTGGSNDAFGFKDDGSNKLTNPGLFAIMPSLGAQFAPYDEANSAVINAQGLHVGDSVYLVGTSTIPAGFYTLLPANYSLLPGAYLISAVSGSTNIHPDTVGSLADGTPVVAGYRSFGNTGLGGGSYSGFAIYPGSWARSLAEYKDTFASNYFASSAIRTIDAAHLSIQTESTLSANGIIKSNAVAGGRNAVIDIAANNLRIVGSVGQGSTGTVTLQDSVLNSWHAGQLLLGGSHQDEGKSIEVAADAVSVAGDAHLVADEVVMVARDAVSIESGGSIKTTSATDDKSSPSTQSSVITLKGAGAGMAALVAVSDLNVMTVGRDASNPGSSQGTIQLNAGSTLATRGALNIDSPNGGILQSTIDGNDAQWTLASQHLVFDNNQVAGQLNIDSAMLNSMQSANALVLRGSTSIDFGNYGSSSITVGNSSMNLMTLQSQAINNISGNVNLRAQTINFDGKDGSVAAPGNAAGSGILELAAHNININSQSIAVNGFAKTTLIADGQLKVNENGALIVDGNLDLSANRITAGAASNGALIASGNVQLNSAGSTATDAALDLGGALSIQGNNITDNADVEMPSGVLTLNAKGQLTLGSTAQLNVSGVPVYAAGVRADSSGGTIRVRSGGNISAIADSQVKADASGNANAGYIDIQAGGNVDMQSTLSAHAALGHGGSISVDANQISNVSILNRQFENGGFTQQQAIHVAKGDLQLGSGDVVTAHTVQWATDSGQIQINGEMDAASGDDRSSIRLYGADGVTVTGILHADGDTGGGRAGNIELGVSTDTVKHSNAGINIANATISANGSEQGQLRLRAPVVNGTNLNISTLPTDLSSLGKVIVEGVTTLSTTGSVDWASVQSAAASAFNNLNNNSTLTSALFSSPKVMLSPGVELDYAGNLDLGAVDIYNWNINGRGNPVSITVRASGNINVNGTLSDGFISVGTGTRKYLAAADTQSATLRLVAGSNLSSADPLKSIAGANADLIIGAGNVVRTGTGDLNLVAAHDVVFAGKKAGTTATAGIDQYSQAYTGGTNAIGIDANGTLDTVIGLSSGRSSSFLTNGGQLAIAAGNDVIGYALTDSVTAWQPRTGCVSVCGNFTSDQKLTSWGIDLRQFLWNAGTLGGGDVSVTAGHDVSSVSVAAAGSALQSVDGQSINNYGGGVLTLSAGNNMNSGMVYVDHGLGTIEANGGVTTSSAWQDSTGKNQGLLVAMGDARISINARTGVDIAAIVNPTTMLQVSGAGSAARAISGKTSAFFTYGSSSSVSILSSSGNVDYQSSATPFFGSLFSSLLGLPASLDVAAYSGNVSGQWGGLYSSDRGNLSVFAGNDIEGLNVLMGDNAESSLVNVFNPKYGASANATQINLPSARHVGDTRFASITAGNDINHSTFDVPKSIRINVGRDLLETSVKAQNVTLTDISSITVGRDIKNNTVPVSVGGPGRLDIVAGRDIDLGAGQGILTTGNRFNANLPWSDGANLTVMAGLSPGWDPDGFVNAVISKSTEGAKALISFASQFTSEQDIDVAKAIEIFSSLSDEQVRPFVLQQFFQELVAAGKEANSGAAKGYSRGYTAIDALFPGGRDKLNPYIGDLSMLYSQIYTLSGGDINLIIPGGSLNVGVANRPLFVTVPKTANELGIVAEKSGNVNIYTSEDVQVNSSRIFTLGGGDISIWSTLGNIDAGKGAKTSLSVPLPSISYDINGNAIVDVTGAVAGSGIRTIQTNPETKAGNVALIAPVGTVDAGDAGIGASGNILVAAAKVIGAENINFGGQASGVPAATSGVGVSLAGASQSGGSSEKSTASSTDDNSRGNKEDKAPIASAALSWLEVFVTGLGEENCKQDDVECLKRQK